MTKETLKAEIKSAYHDLMSAPSPSDNAIEKTLSKCGFYQTEFGNDNEVSAMAINIYNKFYN